VCPGRRPVAAARHCRDALYQTRYSLDPSSHGVGRKKEKKGGGESASHMNGMNQVE